MATALAVSLGLHFQSPFSGSEPVIFAKTALTSTIVTTVVWVIVTLLTRPEPEQQLVDFYRKVRPDVRGWQPVARLAPDVSQTRDIGRNLISWFFGCMMVYLALFGMGKFILGARARGLILLIASALFALALRANLRRVFRAQPGE